MVELRLIWRTIIVSAVRGVHNVTTLSTDAKKAYFAKTRRANYAASLRLEGFSVQPADASRLLPSKEELIKRYRKGRD